MLINNALIVLNVSPFFQQVALGLVLGVAIVADRIRARSRGQARPRGLPVFGAQGSTRQPRETPAGLTVAAVSAGSPGTPGQCRRALDPATALR